MNSSAAPAGLNLAELTADARALIEADKQACLIRYRCQGLNGEERQRKAKELMRSLPADQHALVSAALKARASR
jgi:hypothetical protein